MSGLPILRRTSHWEKYNEDGVAALNRGDYAEAEREFRAALIEAETVEVGDPLCLATSLHNLAGLYRAQDRLGEAEELEARAQAIRARADSPS